MLEAVMVVLEKTEVVFVEAVRLELVAVGLGFHALQENVPPIPETPADLVALNVGRSVEKFRPFQLIHILNVAGILGWFSIPSESIRPLPVIVNPLLAYVSPFL